MNTNMTYCFSFTNKQFVKAFPMDRPPKRCGLRTVYDELWGHTLATGGAFHNYYNGYLEPNERLAKMATEGVYEEFDYPLNVWAFNGRTRQWYAMRPLIVEGPPRGVTLLEGYSYNYAYAKEYAISLIVPILGQRVHTYSSYFNQWTWLPRNTSNTVFPTAEKYPCVTYDLKHRKLIYFYGNSSTYYETWTYDIPTKSWTKLSLSPQPPRGTTFSLFGYHSGMGYDRKNGVVVYLRDNGSATWYLDLDSLKWKDASPTGTPASSGWGSIPYDPVNNVCAVFTFRNDEVWTYKFGGGIANRPDPATDLAGVTSASGITLTWQAPAAGAAPVKYYVYRCEWADNQAAASGMVPGDYVKIDSTAQTTWTDNLTDTLKKAGVVHSYCVSGVSVQGVESDLSDPAFTCLRVPMGLTATALTRSSVLLRWKPRKEADLAGYNVYRAQRAYPRHNMMKATRLNAGLITGQTFFLDDNVQLNPTMGSVDSVVMYVVTAVNLLGRESGFSPYAITHPDWVTNMRADTANKRITWSPPRCGYIANYRIYEGRQGTWTGGSANPTQVAVVTDTFWSYSGRVTSAYKVRAFSTIGQLGFFSDVLAVQSKDDDAFGNYRLDFQTEIPVKDTFYNDLPPLSVAVERAARLKAGGAALEASPNPFRSSVRLSAYFKDGGAPHLEIFNANGRRLWEGEMRDAAFEWNAEKMPAGVYVARVCAGKRSAEKKLVLIR
jgi:fibronectin type 3 domain-containing protein